MNALQTAYRFHRARTDTRPYPMPAAKALLLARIDVEAERPRYLESIGGTLPPAGERGGVWIERPADYGLRFVGFADELAGRAVDHTGWFTDSHGDGDSARGAVYALPTRDGVPCYVEALRTGAERKGDWQDMGTAGGALVFLGDRHKGAAGGYSFDADNDSAVRDAAIGADGEARIYAEAEREYQDSWALGQDAANKVAEAAELRTIARRNLGEMRGLRVDAPSLCATLRGCIRADLERARTLYSEARTLWDDNADSIGWRERLADAFRDGAGAASFAELRK